MSKSKIFLYFCSSFILGVFLSSYLSISNKTLIYLLIIFLILISVWWKYNYLKVLGFCGLFLILGIWRQIETLPQINASHLAYFNDKEEIFFEGVVSDQPDIRINQIKLVVDSKSIKREKEGSDQKISGKALLVLPRHPEYKYGDDLLVSCKLKTPSSFEDFSYKDYLARYNIYSICYYPKITLISKNQGNLFLGSIFKLKNKFERRLAQILPEPHTSFLSGILLGSRGQIPKDLLEKFNVTGITHIIAISGYNITIVSALFLKIFSGRISRRATFIVSCFGIFIFVILTGASSSVVRAAIMGGLVLLALNYGRLSDITNSLVFTACVILFFNPKILSVDIGFQLSFLATIGIVYLSPHLEKFFRLLPQNFKIRESAALTFSAQILVIPIILSNFERISLIAPLANILVLPAIPLTMFFGFVAGFFSLFWLSLGKILAFLPWLSLSYEIFVVNILSKIPFASIRIEKIGTYIAVVYYFLLAILIFCLRKREACELRNKGKAKETTLDIRGSLYKFGK